MAYAHLKDEASATDRTLWLGRRETTAVRDLDITLGFIWEDEDDGPVATIHDLRQFVEHVNAKMR